jgi:hypothetical protein
MSNNPVYSANDGSIEINVFLKKVFSDKRCGVPLHG